MRVLVDLTDSEVVVVLLFLSILLFPGGTGVLGWVIAVTSFSLDVLWCLSCSPRARKEHPHAPGPYRG